MTHKRKHPRFEADFRATMQIGDKTFGGCIRDISMSGSRVEIVAIVNNQSTVNLSENNIRSLAKLIKEKIAKTNTPISVIIEIPGKDLKFKIPFLVRTIYRAGAFGLEVYDGSNSAIPADTNSRLISEANIGKAVLKKLSELLQGKGKGEVDMIPVEYTDEEINQISTAVAEAAAEAAPVAVAESAPAPVAEEDNTPADIREMAEQDDFSQTLISTAADVIPEAFFGIFNERKPSDDEKKELEKLFVAALVKTNTEHTPEAVKKQITTKIKNRMATLRDAEPNVELPALMRKAVYEALCNNDAESFFPDDSFDEFDTMLTESFGGVEPAAPAPAVVNAPPAIPKQVEVWYTTSFVKIGKKNMFTSDLAASLTAYFMDNPPTINEFAEIMEFVRNPRTTGRGMLEQVITNCVVSPDKNRIGFQTVRGAIEPVFMRAVHIFLSRTGKLPLISQALDIITFTPVRGIAAQTPKQKSPAEKAIAEAQIVFFREAATLFAPVVAESMRPLMQDMNEDKIKAIAAREWKEKVSRMDIVDILCEFLLPPAVRESGSIKNDHRQAAKSFAERLRKRGRFLPSGLLIISRDDAQELSEFRRGRLDGKTGIGQQFDVLDIVDLWMNTRLSSSLDPTVREKVDMMIICNTESPYRSIHVLSATEGQILAFYGTNRSTKAAADSFVRLIEERALTADKSCEVLV